jgi:hypothetical protein
VLDAALLQCRGETRAVGYVAAEFSGEQVKTMAQYGVKRVIVCPDPDSGGDKGCESSVESLFKVGVAPYVADRLPNGEDPDDFLKRVGIEGWRQHVANPTPGAVWLARRMLGDITPESPEIERRKALDGLKAFLQGLTSTLDRKAAIEAVAERTGFAVEDIAPGEAVGRVAQEFILAKNGDPARCLTNTILWLDRNKPGWARYDSFRREIILGDNAMTDHGIGELVTEIERSLDMSWPRVHAEGALVTVANRNSYSSLRRYLESLTWDGVNRIESFFPDHYEAEGTDYVREVARVMFLSAARRGLEPGCKVDTVPLLMGAQGLHKSRGVAALCPDPRWFTDNIGSLDGGVETQKRLAGMWIVELSELSAMRRSELETIKQFISSPVDNYRPSYGRVAQDFPRTCVFIGTTNSDHPLQDTENRRFLPIKIEHKGDVAAIEAARDQLWAEAVTRLNRGEKWWITGPTLVEMAREEGRTTRDSDVWEVILERAFGLQDQVTLLEAASALCIDVDKLDRAKQTRIGIALKAIGFAWHKGKRPERTPYYKRVGPT